MNQKHPPAMPAPLAEVALIDAKASAATGGVSVSWWQEEVRSGRAPAPAIRQVRMTRWRLADVRSFWIERASKPNPDEVRIVEHATRASGAAAVKRRATPAASAA